MISIIIVTRNAAGYLQRCLDSIYAQVYDPIEIIVQDGASTDETTKILENNASRISLWKSEKDEGIYDAMNRALDAVRGDWIYFLGADDVLTAAFSDFVSGLRNPDSVYYGSVIKSGKKYLGRLSRYQQAKTGINHQAILYPARLFLSCRYDTAYRISADHVLNMQLNRHAVFSFEFRDFDIAVFNDTGISSVQKDPVFEKRKAQLILRNFGLSIYLRFQFKVLKSNRRAA